MRAPAALLAQAVALLAPPRCLACRAVCAARSVVCPPCRSELAALPHGEPAARRGPQLDGHFAAFPMAGPARELVHALKYGGGVSAAREMALLIARRAPPALFERALIVPAPAHPARRRARGYNQSKLLAGELAALTGRPVADCLTRDSAAPPQTGQPRERRLALGEHAVALRPGCALAAGPLAHETTNVLLLDDVSTTGVTLERCAAAIGKRTGSQIWAVTFAGTSAGPGKAPSGRWGDRPGRRLHSG